MYRFNGFTEKANRAVNLALEGAQELGHTYIGSEHLLLGLLKEGSGTAAELLQSKGVTADKIAGMIAETVGRGSRTNLTTDDFTPRGKHILELAMAAARGLQEGYVGTEHILLAILEEGQSYAVRFLEELGVDPRELGARILNTAQEGAGGVAGQNGPRSQKGKSDTPTLSQFGRDLTAMAAEGKLDPVIGRSKEIERVIQILTRRTKNNPCLIGEPGVGKTAIAEGLALKIHENQVPELLKDKRSPWISPAWWPAPNTAAILRSASSRPSTR